MSNALHIKPKKDCRWDLMALGEVMLRLDPLEERIHTTRQFRAWEGGGEYNVARGLKRCFGLDTSIITALVDNPVGRLVQDLIYQGGVDQSYLRWIDFDGVGRNARNGLNFTERGFGVRAAVGCSDRGHTAISQCKPSDFPFDVVFGRDGVRWLHTGGIFSGLSDSTPSVALEAFKIAKKHGTIISYDLNYRESLWKAVGGKKRAQEVNRMLAPYIDVIIGNEEDFTAALGFEVPGLDPNHSNLDPSNFKLMIQEAVRTFPNFKVVATTLRNVRSATSNDWGAIAFINGEFHQATTRERLEVLDRVGGGDSFASGLIYGLLTGQSAAWCVECGAASGALAMTTPGDTTTASLKEVTSLMKGEGARIAR